MSSSTVMVRNTSRGPTVFSADGHEITWAGAGDPMDEHIQPVPRSFLENVQFTRMAGRGIFEIEEDDATIDATIAKHRAEYEQRMARQQNASQAAMDTSRTDDSLMVECIGPSAKGQGACGTQLPMKVSEQTVKPPLCPQHSALAGQYVPVDLDDKIIGGKAQVRWMPIRMGSTERQN